MSWDQFVIFAIVALLCWGIGAVAAWRGKRQWMVYTATLAGLAVFFAFILGMWISLERPPMRTMGETRLWYSFFLPLAGIITYSRWRYKWILSFSFILSLVFVCINLFKPEIHNKTLMPALQSPWFAPHVIVYMFAYAMLGAAAVMANTAIATAGDIPAMARAFRSAIEAGRTAYVAGMGRVMDKGASASSPLTGFLQD